jgi:hypothetical protein
MRSAALTGLGARMANTLPGGGAPSIGTRRVLFQTVSAKLTNHTSCATSADASVSRNSTSAGDREGGEIWLFGYIYLATYSADFNSGCDAVKTQVTG